MKIFAISDFHLSFAEMPQNGRGVLLKPMEIFGERWQDCYEKLYNNCCKLLSSDDYLLCAGDISWAMQLAETEFDFCFLDSLPCKIVLTKGNHDFWWGGISKVREALPKNCFALQNDALIIGSKVVAGSRGWSVPGSSDWKAHDEKIFLRELLRFRCSLDAAKKTGLPIIAMIHYPPLLKAEPTAFSELFSEYGVEQVIFGHLHGQASLNTPEGLYDGVFYHNTAADFLDFCPKLIWEE